MLVVEHKMNLEQADSTQIRLSDYLQAIKNCTEQKYQLKVSFGTMGMVRETSQLNFDSNQQIILVKTTANNQMDFSGLTQFL